MTAECSLTAYNNEELFLGWIGDEYAPITIGSQKHLLVMDGVAFHKAPAVKKKLRVLGVVTAMIPPGCTGLLQPLDTAINKPVKGAAATQRLASRPSLVSKAFMDCVIDIRPDGSQDDLIRIKDIPASEIDFTRWKVAEDTTMKAEEIVFRQYASTRASMAGRRGLLLAG
ncbi:hypothetical protein E4U23_002740 [Claviceps purpurea]|nr:hypothetical protein E4U23_002740 [Claviceps purpurea]